MDWRENECKIQNVKKVHSISQVKGLQVSGVPRGRGGGHGDLRLKWTREKSQFTSPQEEREGLVAGGWPFNLQVTGGKGGNP